MSSEARSETYRQTVSAELARAIDERRGLLSRQEFTTAALVAAVQQPSVAELAHQVEQLRAEVARLAVASSAPAPAATPAPRATELLTF